MKIYIRAMSEELSEIRRTLSSASKQIDQHIIRLLLYPDAEYTSHWKKEIATFLHDIDRRKGSNKWPKQSFIYDALAVHNDILDNYRRYVIETESELMPIDVALHNIEQCISEYQRWISTELAKSGYVSQADIINELTLLVDKYSK